ncbi:amidohydrolase [Chryseobacterium suipulveris]|uniref:Amidohydrolase n=1 Tax=Chryseobacterium suipulveris TaxID=2929800 RepID=A0ABY4BZE6_9FLAO|nr:amidohydrolase [Chryseobacterium suipulveris]UOE41890.1 amidohydrolase [Chryseobacterium suipulveris]
MKFNSVFRKLFVHSWQLKLVLVFSSVIMSAQKSTDLIIHNARIYTVNKNFYVAQSMAVSKGKIVAVGKSSDILKKYKSKNIQNLNGKTVFPGFIDAHCHFTGYATDKWKCELWGTKSWDEIIARLTEYSKNAPMEWIYGRSWDQNDWPVKEFPNKERLDQLFPNRPVYLKRIDGHAAIANQKALDIAGITLNTKVNGGEIEQKNGKLTGVLIDNAMLVVEKHLPQISDEMAINYFSELQKECFSYGLTSLHDCGITEHTLSLLEKAQSQNILKMKIFALLEDNPDYYDKWAKKGRYTNGNITVGGFKVYSDGALGSRGACLIHDYSDKKGWKGFLLSEEEYFRTLAKKLKNSNLQMCTHAIGDSANRTILKIYGEVLGAKNDRRWRIEHAQIMDKDDFGLFGKYSIIPSVQPTHATSDMYWAEERVGKERLKYSYAYKDLLKQNGWLPLGTDFPVEEISPFKTFLAAVARKDANNFPANGFQKENALTREQAIRGMTIWAAKAGFQENEIGSLEVGKSADFIILNQDLMKVPEDQILKTKVLKTYSSGKQVF